MSAESGKKPAMHETYAELGEIEGPSNRAFGLTVGGILLALAGLGALTGHIPATLAKILAVIGAPLVVVGLIFPKALGPLNFIWTKFGLLLGMIITPILMFAIYVLMFTPFGVVMRARGYDPLRLRREEAAHSYWVERDPPGPEPKMMAEQF